MTRPTRLIGTIPVLRAGVIGYDPSDDVGDLPDPIDFVAEEGSCEVPAQVLTIGSGDDVNLSDGTVTDGGGDKTFLNPTNANDGDGDTAALRSSFAAPGTGQTSILRTDLGAAFLIETVTIHGGAGATANAHTAQNWTLQRSPDNTNWTTVSTTQVLGTIEGDQGFTTITLDTPASFRYWRIIHTSGASGFQNNLWVHTWSLSESGLTLSGEVWVPAPLVNDGDDVTFEFVTDAFTECLRVTMPLAYRFATARLRIGCEDAVSRTYDLEGANVSDFSDAVQIATETFTATGSYTAQDVAYAWDSATAYRYYRLIGPAENRRLYTFEMFEAPEGGGVTDHGALTGLPDDDHPQYDTFANLGWFNVLDYGAVGDGVTDDTVAIQAAIDACAAFPGGTLYFPQVGSGPTYYQLDGALTDTGTYNSQLQLPNNGDFYAIRFLGGGANIPFIGGGLVAMRSSWNGSISGTPAVIAAGTHDDLGVDANKVFASFQNIGVFVPENPKLTAIDMTAGYGLHWDELTIGADWSTPFEIPVTWSVPTNTNAIGVDMPWGSNDQPYSGGGNLYINGFYTGLRPSEQTGANLVSVSFCARAIEFRGNVGAPANLRHECTITRLATYWVNYGLVFTGDERWVHIGQWDAEHSLTPFTTTYDIDDASNYGRGFIRWHTPDWTDGPEDNLLVNGGTGLSLHGSFAKRWKLTNVVDIPVGTDPSTNPANGFRLYAASATGKPTTRSSTGTVTTIMREGDTAGGNLSGTYPNPTVANDSHSHTAATLPADLVSSLIPVDAGAVAYDTSTPGELGITVTSDWGVDAGVAYYDDAGAAAGEEAALFWDPDTGQYTVIAYDFP